jgi:hypothetical protein
VVVLIRGGGSKTELATFDHESIATAIATSPTAGVHRSRSRGRPQRRRRGRAQLAEDPTACAAALVEHVYAFQTQVEQVWSPSIAGQPGVAQTPSSR